MNFTEEALRIGVDARIIVLNSIGMNERSLSIRMVCHVLRKERVYWLPLEITRYLRSLSKQPTTMIVSFWPLVIAAGLLKLIPGFRSLRLVFWEHAATSRYTPLSKILLRLVFHRVDYVIGWRHSWSPLKALVNQNVRFIDTGNPIRFPASYQNKRCGFTSPYRIVACARLVPQKRIMETVYAFLLSETFEGSTLTIMGDGPSYFMLRDLIDYLQLSNVFLMGNVSSPVELFGNYDLCVIMSPEEGFCNVVVESLACETPVLTIANNSVAEDLVQMPDCGLVLQTGTIDDFSTALDVESKTPKRARSCRSAIENYKSENWTRLLLERLGAIKL